MQIPRSAQDDNSKKENYRGYWNEYPPGSFPDMNLVLYSSR